MKIEILSRGFGNILEALDKGNCRFIYGLSLNYAWAFFKIPLWVPKPLELQLEPSFGCNLRCKMCNIKQIIKKNNCTFITEENFNNLLDQILPMKTMNFTGMGESLLNKHLESFILKANSCNIRTLFITNGLLLTQQRVDKVIASKVNGISISMESGDPATYELIRSGATFDKLKENVKNLTEKIKENRSDIIVLINVVLLKHNIEDITNIYKLIDFAARYGISNISLQNPHDVFSSQTFVYLTEKKDYLKNNFELIKNYADKRNIKVFFPSLDIKEGSCYYPWVYPQITVSGELLPCCIIPQFGDYAEIIEKYSFGNVFVDGFERVWNSKKATKFRSCLSQKKPNEYCQKCSKYLGIL